MLNKSYKEFSQIYDMLMDDVDYEKWTSFIINKIGASRKILEAACGTGSITHLLGNRGYLVTAFDLSQDMLMRAYEKLKRSPGVKLLNMDMTSFNIDDKFDTAICCCDGINYLDSDGVMSFFNNVFKHLKDNSKFIFDMSTIYKYDTMFNDTYVYDDDEIFYVWENAPDSEKTFVNIEINFFIKDSQNKYTRINEIQTQYIHRAQDIVEMLEQSGFKNIEIYDDYNDELYRESSLRAVFCVEK